MKTFLRTKGTKIIDEKGQAIYLRGVNLGGWLMMEAYFMHSPNLAVHRFKDHFKKVLGEKALIDFEHSFQNNFIKESDFKNIKQQGFNCIRLPFNGRLIETAISTVDISGLKCLDDAVRWAKKYKIFIILDLHAAPGAQNHDWHSDSDGRALLWDSSEYQKRTLAIWEFVANRYKDEYYVAGYDLLNEAVLNDSGKLNKLYKQIITTIRSVDKNHILFVEGSRWAQDLECLEEFDDDNYVLSVHNYEPLEFTFNFVPHLHYPLKTKEGKWNKQIMLKHLLRVQNISKQRNVPIFVGEFGVNTREGLYGEDQWLEDTLSVYKRYGFHWTYWTYKAVKNYLFPDGIYSYKGNPPWVHREGPLEGWDTYHLHWPTSKKQMIESWDTKEFTVNPLILKTLKKHAK
ncbi:MAG: glycoside hydrolase family 5 protein [Candidatus Omnitrophica bacterium]|nr:glycoside hydrolase family 5 protein [Candidatus Omnitrophota bacterium]